jgi:3-phenylpropionate/cinnamic acid dioxygenase small subunit
MSGPVADADLVARTRIADVLVRYCFAIDDKDWAALHEVFTPDCVADYGDFGLFEGADAVVAWMAPVHVGLVTQHALGNVLVTVDGDRAASRSYVTVTLQPDGGAMFRTGGSYRDELRRDGDRWRIARRTYATIWREDIR